MKVFNKITLGAMGVALVTNPLTGSVILEGLEKGFALVFKYGSPINLIASLIVCVWLVWTMWNSREQVSIPVKSKKTTKNAMKYELQ